MTTASLTPQTALPCPDRSVHERLMALESKQLAYRSLSSRLLELPRKLRRRALVPVAPRLYLPGELVRTNEILVLLGSAGEATYFAERSAWQAHEIVRRRLGRVERGLRELLDEMSDECMIGYADRNRNTRDESNSCGERAPKRIDSISTEKANVGPDQDERGKGSGFKSSISSNDTDDTTDVSARAQPASVLSKHPKRSYTVAKKKRVTFKEPLTSPSLNASPQQCFTSPPKAKAESQKKKKKNPVPARSSGLAKEISSVSDAPNEKLAGNQQHRESAPNADAGDKTDMQAKIMKAFEQAVEDAKKQVMEDGIVNITEVYEGDEDTPSRVELPAGFEPDKNISFDDDSQDYLDITGTKGKNDGEEFSRDEYFDALIQADRNKQAEEEQAKAKRRTTELERERKEFGKGFAKGFFGAAPKKAAPARSEQSSVGEQTQAETPSTQITASAAAEAVVERKPSRKSKRRSRRPRTNTSASPSPMCTALVKQEAQDRMDIGLLGDEDMNSNDEPKSMFRKLRNLQRESTP